MTTVIVDRKRGKVYSDSRATHTNISGIFKNKEEHTYSKTTKIFSIHRHVITGCGSLRVLHEVVDRFHKSKHLPDTFYFRDKQDCDNTCVLVTKRSSGDVYTVMYNLSVSNLLEGWKRVKVDKDFIGEDFNCSVRGSGMELAIGALEQGATPEEAIKIASKHDMYTDDNIQTYDIP